MSLSNDGEKIVSIYIGKKKVIIKFPLFKIDVPFDVYSSLYLYEGKMLSNKEIEDLKHAIKGDKLYQYAKKILSKNLYSEKEIKDKLVKKEASNEEKSIIIAKLKENHLIDDEEYLKAMVDAYLKKGYGHNRIVKSLLEKGIKEEKIKGYLPPSEEECERANALLPRLEKQYSNVNYSSKKKKIYNTLLRNGYDHQVALKVLENIKFDNYENELKLLRRDYEKSFLKYLKKVNNLELAKSKTQNYLLGKGYRYKDIELIEEKFEDESRMD